jgi:putative addiction module antidote
MMIKLKVTTAGNSMGVIFPKELVEKLRLSKGDMLYLLETPNGFELTPYDPEFVQQMEVAEEVMREDWNILRKLAT